MLSILAAALTLAPQGQSMVAESPEAAKPLQAGVMAPDAKILTADNKPTTLKAAFGGKPTVLIFYRGGWCPFCNRHLAAVGQVQDQLKQIGFQTIAVSPDLPANLGETMEKDNVDYKIYSDPSANSLKAYGVAFRLDDKTFDLYKNNYKIDLEARSGSDHHILPVPSVFLIDAKGMIVFSHSNPDYRIRMSGEEIVTAAKKAAMSNS